MKPDGMSLERLRRKSLRLIVNAIWLQIPFVAIAGWVNGAPLLIPLLAAVAIAVTAEAFARAAPDGVQARIVAGVAVMGSISLLVASFSGNKMQVDLHMYYFAALALYYFAALALLVAACDWRVIVAGAATVAVHHVVLNFALPSLIYPRRRRHHSAHKPCVDPGGGSIGAGVARLSDRDHVQRGAS